MSIVVLQPDQISSENWDGFSRENLEPKATLSPPPKQPQARAASSSLC